MYFKMHDYLFRRSLEQTSSLWYKVFYKFRQKEKKKILHSLIEEKKICPIKTSLIRWVCEERRLEERYILQLITIYDV